MEAAINALAKIQGWLKPVKDRKMAEARTMFHKRVITAAVDAHPDLAREYYRKHKKTEIDSSSHPNIEKLLEAGTLRKESQRKTDEIIIGEAFLCKLHLRGETGIRYTQDCMSVTRDDVSAVEGIPGEFVQVIT